MCDELVQLLQNVQICISICVSSLVVTLQYAIGSELKMTEQRLGFYSLFKFRNFFFTFQGKYETTPNFLTYNPPHTHTHVHIHTYTRVYAEGFGLSP